MKILYPLALIFFGFAIGETVGEKTVESEFVTPQSFTTIGAMLVFQKNFVYCVKRGQSGPDDVVIWAQKELYERVRK